MLKGISHLSEQAEILHKLFGGFACLGLRGLMSYQSFVLSANLVMKLLSPTLTKQSYLEKPPL